MLSILLRVSQFQVLRISLQFYLQPVVSLVLLLLPLLLLLSLLPLLPSLSLRVLLLVRSLQVLLSLL